MRNWLVVVVDWIDFYGRRFRAPSRLHYAAGLVACPQVVRALVAAQTMHYILVFNRRTAELFAFDTASGEQQTLGSCCPRDRIFPSQAAALQKNTAIEYSTRMQELLLDFVDVDTPVIVASHKELPDRFVRHVIEHFRRVVDTECRVSECGQMGFNQVIREQLTLDDAGIRVATVS